MGAEGGAEVHFGDFGEVAGAVFGNEFFRRGVHSGGSAFGESEAELFFESAEAGDEFVAREDGGGGDGEVLFGAMFLDQFDFAT